METSDTSHELNGQVVKPKRQPRPKKGEKDARRVRSQKPTEVKDAKQNCRNAAEVETKNVRYLIKPWFPMEALTIVAGEPSVGKSTFGAWLIAQAGVAGLLPGFEESLECMTVPRLAANGADLHKVFIFDGWQYKFPRDTKVVTEKLIRQGARLLLIDPVDSYMEDEKSENSGPDVREYLESFQKIAEQAGVAVVGIRHPGKDAKNLMPGSRQWKAVPRSIVHLQRDISDPAKLTISHEKDSYGNDARPKRYSCVGEQGKPRKLVLGMEVEAGYLRLSQAMSDPTDRIDVRKAGRYARHLFETGADPLVTDLCNLCRQNGVGDRARREALRILEIDEKPSGMGGKWVMFRESKDWPKWTEQQAAK